MKAGIIAVRGNKCRELTEAELAAWEDYKRLESLKRWRIIAGSWTGTFAVVGGKVLWNEFQDLAGRLWQVPPAGGEC